MKITMSKRVTVSYVEYGEELPCVQSNILHTQVVLDRDTDEKKLEVWHVKTENTEEL